MSKYEEANLILKLYELRREDTLRKARDWFFRDFYPESLADYNAVMFSAQSGYARMVLSYWDMAAALVLSGAISISLFEQTCPEAINVFAKVERIIPEIRAAYSARSLTHLEEVVDQIPDGRARAAAAREMFQRIRASMAPAAAAPELTTTR